MRHGKFGLPTGVPTALRFRLLRVKAVLIGAVRFAFRRIASRAVEATKRSRRSKPDMGTPSGPMKFWILQKQKLADHEIFDFVGTENRSTADSKIF